MIISQANIKDIESKGVFKHKSSSYLTSFVFQVGDKLLVLNINSRAQVSIRQASAQGRNALPLDQIRKHGTQIENIIEVNISTAYGSKLGFSPGKHFHKEGTVTIQSSSLRDYSRINKAEGYFYQINSNVNNLKAKFNGAVDHHSIKN
ncbi:MAG: hypothetical protein KTV77_04750 [Wolbachia endosymbiont of Fragariocoptes setiger]|nr:hypothetical protein [Wolbachia endosymbiont of Fragariocoptes setiger]